MDQQEFERLLRKLPPASKPATSEPAAELDPQPLADAAAALGLSLSDAGIPPPTQEEPTAQTVGDMGDLGAMVGVMVEPDYSQPPAEEPGLGDPSSTDAIAGGALKGVFETKDFLFGDTPPEDRSEFRANVEDTVELRKQQSMVDGFSSGIAQFAIGMIGLSKARYLTKAVPWVASGLGVMEGTRKGVAALQTAKAATAGAIAFDPHEERLSNIIQDTPLANPINDWLAADPDDGDAEGRIKSALESIGLDVAILGTFMFATKAWKAMRSGRADEAERLTTDFQQEVQRAQQSEAPTPATETIAAEPEAPAAQPATETHTDAPASAAVEERAAAPSGPTAPAESLEGNSAKAEEAGAQPAKEPTEPAIAVTPTEAAQAVGEDLPSQSAKPRVKLSLEDTSAVLDGMSKDADAIAKHGGWYEAIQAGHTFGKGEGIPWVKLNQDADVDDFMARVVDAAEERLDDLKGGKVLSDKRVQKLVDQRVALFNEDPALVLGAIQQAGKNATHAVAEMEAGYLVANRMFQDTYALASRIRMGDFVEFGSRDAAIDALKHRLSLAASVYGSARSITAASGRGVRRMRRDFKLDPKAVAQLQQLDGDQLTELLVNTQGNPRSLAKMANPTLWTKAVDFGQFLLINNLVSGPKTQLINATTNAYMVGARPMERILGSVLPAIGGDPRSRAILMESTRQYLYTGTALREGFALVRKAFLLNDSVLAPHRSEIWKGAQSGATNAVPSRFMPLNSIGNWLHNGLVVATGMVGLPTRTLGSVDELVKQTVYRSKVMARAHMEAVAEGAQGGLSGDALKSFVRTFVRDKMDAAFDQAGRAVDPEALREANIATFQQDLLPGTLGKTVSTAVANHPALRLVLPFVKTPTNVLRYGFKLTPGLNLLQREYRDMWAGRLGREAQVQAYGQMTLGMLYLGSAAYLVSGGHITGGGPSDYKAAAELRSTGWCPYCVVIERDDGSKTYVPFNRFDPVAMPFALVADMQDAIAALGAETDDEVESHLGSAMGALAIALATQLREKTYLVGLEAAMDAFLDPERSMGTYAGRTASNFVPYSAALRQLNTDPYLREASDVWEKVKATIPGLSETVPARYDAWGEPVYIRKGLWSNAEDQLVDLEVQRLALEGGSTITRVNPVNSGVDLRDVVMEDGKNAYEVYQQLSGKPHPRAIPLKKQVAKVMASETYKRAPDGDVDVRGTKLWMLHSKVSRYRTAAMKRLKRDKAVQDAFLKETRRVRAEWQASRKASGEAKAKPTRPNLGEAFGVDLGALFTPPQQQQ